MELLECALYYHLEELEKSLLEGLVAITDESNFVKMLNVAKSLNCDDPKGHVKAYVTEKFIYLHELDAFGELDFGLMNDVIECQTLVVCSEADVLSAIIGWLKDKIAREIAILLLFVKRNERICAQLGTWKRTFRLGCESLRKGTRKGFPFLTSTSPSQLGNVGRNVLQISRDHVRMRNGVFMCSKR